MPLVCLSGGFPDARPPQKRRAPRSPQDASSAAPLREQGEAVVRLQAPFLKRVPVPR